MSGAGVARVLARAGLVTGLLVATGCTIRRFKEPAPVLPAHAGTKTYLSAREARDEAFRASAAPLLDVRPRPLPRPVETRLSNGVRAIFIERSDFPAVTAALVLDRGSTSARPGVAATYAYAMLERSEVADDEPWSQLRFLGARVHTTVDRDRVTMTVNALSPLFSPALKNAASLFVRPALGDDAVERASITVAAQRNVGREAPSALSAEALVRTLFPLPHPWGVPVTGERLHRKRPGLDEDARMYVDDSTLVADVRAFRDGYVTAEHVGVVCIGDMGPKAMEPIVERALAKLPKKPSLAEAPAPLPAVTASPRRILVVDRPGMTQANLALGWISPRATDPDAVVVEVLASATGSGLGSILNLSARRDMGATYGVHTHLLAGRDAGSLTIVTAVDVGRTAAVLSSIDAELERLRITPLDDATLAMAKLKSHVALEAGTAQGLAQLYAKAIVDGRSASDVVDHDARVDALTAEQVRAAAAKHLARDTMQVVVVGDAARIEPALRALALGDVVVKR